MEKILWDAFAMNYSTDRRQLRNIVERGTRSSQYFSQKLNLILTTAWLLMATWIK